MTLEERVTAASISAGLDLTIVRSPKFPYGPGFGLTIAQKAPLTFRFVRDRWQDTLELSPLDQTDGPYFSVGDVEVALGWRTLDDVVGGNRLRPLEELLSFITNNWTVLSEQLQGGLHEPGWQRVARAQEARSAAMVARYTRSP